MNETVKKVLYYLGIIAALYIFFVYLLPLILKVLGFAFKAIFFIFMWAAIGVVVILLILYIAKAIREKRG